MPHSQTLPDVGFMLMQVGTNFSEFFVARRNLCGLSQGDLAKRAGVGSSSVWRLSVGKTIKDAGVLERIAKALRFDSFDQMRSAFESSDLFLNIRKPRFPVDEHKHLSVLVRELGEAAEQLARRSQDRVFLATVARELGPQLLAEAGAAIAVAITLVAEAPSRRSSGATRGGGAGRGPSTGVMLTQIPEDQAK